MLSRFVLKAATSPTARIAPWQQMQNGLVLQQKRSVSKRFDQAAPPQRHLTFTQHVIMFSTICFVLLSYPTYMLMNLDNIRPPQREDFSDELKAQLEERRKQRAEGKLNVLVQKT